MGAVLLAVIGVLSSCQEVKVGARCKGNTAASSGAWVVTCKKGHWTKLITKADGLAYVARIQAQQAAASATTTMPPVVTAPPATVPPPASTTTTTTAPPPPPANPPESSYVSVQSAGDHTCAQDSVGQLFCWGRDDRGQIGDGTVMSAHPTAALLPFRVGGFSVGADFTCALAISLTPTPEVLCWGANDRGQVGDGTTTDRSSPTAVILPVPTSIDLGTPTSGSEFTCINAIHASDIYCWGDNSRSQLTSAATGSFASTPVTVNFTTHSLLGFSAGADHFCTMVGGALFTDDRDVYCWGANDRGQLGDGTTTDRATPTMVAVGAGSVRWLATSALNTCASDGGENIWCWGDNSVGEVGNGTISATPVTTPQLVLTNTTNAPSLSPVGTTGDSMCASVAFQPVTCWGSNASGQLGVVAPSASGTPSVLTDDGGYEMAGAFAVGPSSSCEIVPDDGNFPEAWIYCWGDDTYGQLGY
jgi:alpha-tubulin suppressor-like RCC1 family protein